MRELLSGPLIRLASGLPADEPSGDINGDSLVHLAARHGLAPLLYSRWREGERPGFISPSLLEVLKSHYTETAIRNSWLISDLYQILGLASKKSLEIIALKGISQVVVVYGDPGVRPMDDLDLLTDPEDMEAVIGLLEDLGFEEQRYFESTASEQLNREQVPEWITLLRDRTLIDLHSTIPTGTPGKPLSCSLALDHSRMLPFEEKRIRVPSPAFLLLHLLIHLEKHLHKGITRYSNLVDILRLIREKGKEMDWDTFRKLAHGSGTLTRCMSWLELIRREFSLELPDGKLDHRDLKKVYNVYRNWMKKGEREVKPVIPPWKRDPYKRAGSMALKIRYFLGILFPDAAYMIRTYGIRNRFYLILYYPYRLVAHTLKYLFTRAGKN